MKRRAEVTLHEFHEDLKLTDAQEPAWANYVEKLTALARDVARESRSRPAQPDIAQSANALHAGLTPEQQKMADPRLANLIAMPLAARSPLSAN
jgi:hypothetical protein